MQQPSDTLSSLNNVSEPNGLLIRDCTEQYQCRRYASAQPKGTAGTLLLRVLLGSFLEIERERNHKGMDELVAANSTKQTRGGIG